MPDPTDQQNQEIMAQTPCDADCLTAIINICHIHRLLASATREIVMYHPNAAQRELGLIVGYLARIQDEVAKMPEAL